MAGEAVGIQRAEVQCLVRAIQEVADVKSKYLARRRMIDDDAVAEARERHRDGEYETAGEALHDVLAERHAAAVLPPYAALRRQSERSTPPASWFKEEFKDQ